VLQPAAEREERKEKRHDLDLHFGKGKEGKSGKGEKTAPTSTNGKKEDVLFDLFGRKKRRTGEGRKKKSRLLPRKKKKSAAGKKGRRER